MFYTKNTFWCDGVWLLSNVDHFFVITGVPESRTFWKSQKKCRTLSYFFNFCSTFVVLFSQFLYLAFLYLRIEIFYNYKLSRVYTVKIIILQSLLNLYSDVGFQFAFFWVILRRKILAEKCPPEKNTLFESRTLAVLFAKR